MIHKFLQRIMQYRTDYDSCTPTYGKGKIIIYEGELRYLSQCIIESPSIETGGNLFGLWTPFGIPFIQYVVGPGPKAIHHHTHFRQDFNFLEKNADLLVDEHALHHIGSWHSHHSLGLAEPSGGDTESTFSGMTECNLDSFVLMIGNYRNGKSTVNAFRYFSNGRIEKLKWVILKGESPIRMAYDKEHASMVYTPQSKPNMMPLEQCQLIDKPHNTSRAPKFKDDYWLVSPDNRKELAAIVKFLKTQSEAVHIFQTDSTTVEVQMKAGKNELKFVFDRTFPQNAPKLLVRNRENYCYLTAPKWNMQNQSISETFIHFFKAIQL